MFAFLAGFNANVWVLMALELFERLAYYGVTFTLSTFSVYMLGVKMSTMNILMNITYVLSPLAALIGGGMSDGRWGRKWVLLGGAVVYTAGLSAVASSAMPWVFDEFPNEPSQFAVPVLVIGLALLSIGYGCMKVCLAPLLADSALVAVAKGRCCTKGTCGGCAGMPCCGGGGNAIETGTHTPMMTTPTFARDEGFPSGINNDTANVRTAADADVADGEEEAAVKSGGCQCGCQDGGVCGCNSVVTAESNKAFGHVIGNARQSVLTASSRAFREDPMAEAAEFADGGVSSLFRVSSGADGTKGAASSPLSPTSPNAEEAKEADEEQQALLEDALEEEASSLLSRLFRLDYFVINFGSMIGIGGAPFLRDADPRTRTIVDEDDGGEEKTVHVGYYIAFWACAGATLLGTIVYVLRLRHYPMNQPSRTMLIAKVSWASLRGRWLYGKFRRGAAVEYPRGNTSAVPSATASSPSAFLSSEEQMTVAVAFYDAVLSPTAPAADDWAGPRLIMFAQFEAFVASHGQSPSSAAPVSGGCCGGSRAPTPSDAESESSASLSRPLTGSSADAAAASPDHVTAEEAKAFALTMALCVSFSPLPVYWLLASQFSSNVVMQSGWMDMPASLPPEIFNNVNTGTILVLIPIMDFILARWHAGRRISVVARMTVGFLLMFVSMGFCAALQLVIAARGTFVTDSKYVPHEGSGGLISALWLIIPFVLQGAAAVFVDTTSVEAAYTAAPAHMKSTVMALYLLASAGSGFLGLAFAPFISAENMATIMLTLCGLQLLVTLLFWALSRGLDALPCCSRGGNNGEGKGRSKKAVIEHLNRA